MYTYYGQLLSSNLNLCFLCWVWQPLDSDKAQSFSTTTRQTKQKPKLLIHKMIVFGCSWFWLISEEREFLKSICTSKTCVLSIFFSLAWFVSVLQFLLTALKISQRLTGKLKYMFVKELLMKPLYCNAYEESLCLPAHQQSKSISDFVRSPLSFNILLNIPS